MPLVKINMLKGKAAEYKKTVFDCVHQGLKEQKKAAIEIITSKLVEALSIAPEDVFIIITEPPFENWGIAGKQKG